MRFTTLFPALLAAAAVLAPAAASAHGNAHGQPSPQVEAPTLTARSTLPATLYQPGPISGTALATTPVNGITAPFPGQPIPGFSGILRDRDGKIVGLPDNGFGSKANSGDYFLKLNIVEPNWKTAAPVTSPRNSGNATVERTIYLSDPWHKAGFPLHREGQDRQLTGADFDIESIQWAPGGGFWIGEEFGPLVLRFDRFGRLVQAPIALPGVKSPFSPDLQPGETPNLPASGGFEAMAALPGGKTLLPITEKAVSADAQTPARRLIHELDARRGRYTGRTWDYRTDLPNGLVADAQALDAHRLLILERDDFEGAKAAVKKVYAVDLRVTNADGSLAKTLVADLLNLANPGVTQETPGVYGLGNPFKFALQSVESLLPIEGHQLLLASDNNFPGSNGRVTGKPDDTEMIRVQLPTGGRR